MKTDRFMKAMLVIIALLLAANCFTGIRAPFSGNSSEAAPPRFLQKEKIYHITLGEGLTDGDFKITEIEDTGWIKVQRWDTSKNAPLSDFQPWINTAVIATMRQQ